MRTKGHQEPRNKARSLSPTERLCRLTWNPPNIMTSPLSTRLFCSYSRSPRSASRSVFLYCLSFTGCIIIQDGLTDSHLLCQLCCIDQHLNEKVSHIHTGFVSTYWCTDLSFHQSGKNCHKGRREYKIMPFSDKQSYIMKNKGSWWKI